MKNTPKMVRVRATAPGFDGLVTRAPGDEFDMPSDQKGDWFEPVSKNPRDDGLEVEGEGINPITDVTGSVVKAKKHADKPGQRGRAGVGQPDAPEDSDLPPAGSKLLPQDENHRAGEDLA